MKYVLDSNVGLKWLLPEADSDKALRIRDDYRRQVHDLIAPDVFPVEVARSLTRAERQGRITPAEGQSHFGDMIATLPMLHPYLPLLPRAYELSSQARIGVRLPLFRPDRARGMRVDDRGRSAQAKPALASHPASFMNAMNVSKKGPDLLGSRSHQAGASDRPLGAMVNTAMPPGPAPDGPATPPGGPATTVIRPHIGKAGRVRSVGFYPASPRLSR